MVLFLLKLKGFFPQILVIFQLKCMAFSSWQGKNHSGILKDWKLVISRFYRGLFSLKEKQIVKNRMQYTWYIKIVKKYYF